MVGITSEVIQNIKNAVKTGNGTTEQKDKILGILDKVILVGSGATKILNRVAKIIVNKGNASKNVKTLSGPELDLVASILDTYLFARGVLGG